MSAIRGLLLSLHISDRLEESLIRSRLLWDGERKETIAGLDKRLLRSSQPATPLFACTVESPNSQPNSGVAMMDEACVATAEGHNVQNLAIKEVVFDRLQDRYAKEAHDWYWAAPGFLGALSDVVARSCSFKCCVYQSVCPSDVMERCIFLVCE